MPRADNPAVGVMPCPSCGKSVTVKRKQAGRGPLYWVCDGYTADGCTATYTHGSPHRAATGPFPWKYRPTEAPKASDPVETDPKPLAKAQDDGGSAFGNW